MSFNPTFLRPVSGQIFIQMSGIKLFSIQIMRSGKARYPVSGPSTKAGFPAKLMHGQFQFFLWIWIFFCLYFDQIKTNLATTLL